MMGDYQNKSMDGKARGKVTVLVKGFSRHPFEWVGDAELFERLECTLTKELGAGTLKATGQNLYEWTVAHAAH